MEHEVKRGFYHGTYYHCERCGAESSYELRGDCVDFQSLPDDELRSLIAEWYLKHRQALDIYHQLLKEKERRAEEHGKQVYFTSWGTVVSD